MAPRRVTGDDGIATVGQLDPRVRRRRQLPAGDLRRRLRLSRDLHGHRVFGPAVPRWSLNAGDGQTAVAGSTVALDPSVKVTDAGGNPVSGVVVTFAVASGGGSVTGASATTNASGIATVGSWRLGTDRRRQHADGHSRRPQRLAGDLHGAPASPGAPNRMR